MSKTIVSAFDDRQKASGLLQSAAASGFDSRFFRVIGRAEASAIPLRSMMPNLPGIQARLYEKRLRAGDSLLVAQVSEDEVPRLIRLFQSTGGHLIEAFDLVKAG